ncbi:MAG: cell envelope integrity protein CreD, partial [Odoribacter sp.]|nr:cell envelope integrity protein CreD [Odoribacter sp.]
ASEATREVQNKWSSSQRITGPFITIHYYENNEETYHENGVSKTRVKKVKNYIHILPENLDITGNVETEELSRGLYDIVVYKAPLALKGKFVIPEHLKNTILPEDIIFQQATLNLGISDLRGISEQITVNWGEETLQFNPGLPSKSISSSGVSCALPQQKQLQVGDSIAFSIQLQLKGSESIQFCPFGNTTQVNLTSNCTTPSFTGDFLPENRKVSNSGFTADWKVLNLNRNYPQVFTDNQFHRTETFSAFGVNLLLPVQQYQQSMRSVKYASLIIILTFVISFFVEVIQKKNIHPFQYLLVGLGLCLFYTLLIAISEHLGFNLAYLISAVMTVTLLTLYMRGILKIRKTAFTIGGLLALLYLYIFVLIQMETYALLAGSLGLFIILAIIMYYSQKINWNGGNKNQNF